MSFPIDWGLIHNLSQLSSCKTMKRKWRKGGGGMSVPKLPELWQSDVSNMWRPENLGYCPSLGYSSFTVHLVFWDTACGGSNENGPHRPTCLNNWSLVSGTNQKEVLVGVSLLEKVCHWGWTLRFQKSMPGWVSHSLCPPCINWGVELSATALAYACLLFAMMIMD